jgi:uncharacterized protein YbjT (DUF2867 family)
MRIAVAGGTGWTGRLVVDALRSRGDEVVVLARSAGVDLITGAGLAAGLDGVETVVDVSNVTTTSAKVAVEFFSVATGNLMTAAAAAGVAHVVALSIVGVDRVGLGYYLGKRAQEDIVLGGGVPSTVLRATQFHEFAAQMLARGGPIALAPRMLCQPVALVEVAEHLAELAHRPTGGLAPELAGPEERLRMEDMVRRLARARHVRRPVLALRVPGKAGRALTDGALLPAGPGPRGTITFDRWLAAQEG